MPANATEAAVFAPLPTRRSAYDQVAVAGTYDYEVAPATWGEVRQPNQSGWVRLHASSQRPMAPKPIGSTSQELRARLVADQMLREVEGVSRQLAAKQAYYEDIEQAHVLAVTALLTVHLWQQAIAPGELVFTLTYDQSLHVRAALPHGALHASVLLTPGLSPMQQLGQREEEDNTIVSIFGPDGKWQAGTEGPFMACLEALPGLLAQRNAAVGQLVG